MAASGATAIAGFAVLAFSNVTMLRDFGLVTVVDLTVSLLGVLAVLPAVLVLAERRAARPRPGAGPRRRRRAPSRRERAPDLDRRRGRRDRARLHHLNTIRTPEPGRRRVRAGAALPPFAAQLATSADRRDFDANVGPRACAVRGPGVVNSCALAERGPVVIAFTIIPSQRCEQQ